MHLLEVAREALGQRLPVLEDVAPVALVAVDRLPVLVPDVDREAVPRPARVAVAAAERERQVRAAQPSELGIARRLRGAPERVERDRLWQGGQPAFHAGVQRSVLSTQERVEVATRESVRVEEGPATHAVEEDAGEVVDGGRLVRRVLQPIGRGDHSAQALPISRNGRPKLGLEQVGMASRSRSRTRPAWSRRVSATLNQLCCWPGSSSTRSATRYDPKSPLSSISTGIFWPARNACRCRSDRMMSGWRWPTDQAHVARRDSYGRGLSSIAEFRV